MSSKQSAAAKNVSVVRMAEAVLTADARADAAVAILAEKIRQNRTK